MNSKSEAFMTIGAAQGWAEVGQNHPHESAILHVLGEATYTDDIPEAQGTLHAALGLSPKAHARILSINLEPVKAMPGVVAVYTYKDIPGTNDCGPIIHDDPILAEEKVEYVGQPIFIVVAQTHDQARHAARKADIQYEELPAILTPEAARDAESFVVPPMRLTRGDAKAAFERSKNILKGTLHVGGQEQFYLEGQISYALPKEAGGMHVYCSTQHPTEMQHVVAHALHIASHAVVIECRRMGGAFGGKESQSALWAACAAVCANALKRPVKLRADRDDDMTMSASRRDKCSMRGKASRSIDRCGCLRVRCASCGAKIKVPKPSVAPTLTRPEGPSCDAGAARSAPSTADSIDSTAGNSCRPASVNRWPPASRANRATPICFSRAWMRRDTVVCSTDRRRAAPAKVPRRANSKNPFPHSADRTAGVMQRTAHEAHLFTEPSIYDAPVALRAGRLEPESAPRDHPLRRHTMNAPTSTAVLAPTVKLLIGGKFVESQTTQWRNVVNPATQEVLARVPFATPEEINAAVASGKEAFKTWKKTPIGTRARIFLKLQQLIRENMAELAALLTAEQGKTLPDAEGDVFRGLEVVEHAAGIGNLQLGELANNVANGVDTYT
eukprot:gene39425-48720_t